MNTDLKPKKKKFFKKMIRDFTKFEVLSFDCYGTLIDWEKGIFETLNNFLTGYGIKLQEDLLLEMYALYESQFEQGKFVPYKDILKKIVLFFAKSFKIKKIKKGELDLLINSLPNWEPFPDTNPFLVEAKKHFRLMLISNVDRDLLSETLKKFDVTFDFIVTSEDVSCYKPNPEIFKHALDVCDTDKSKILHIAQSLYHDIKPAGNLGIKSVWVNRRKNKKGFGATPAAIGDPDHEVPDLFTLLEDIKKSFEK